MIQYHALQLTPQSWLFLDTFKVVYKKQLSIGSCMPWNRTWPEKGEELKAEEGLNKHCKHREMKEKGRSKVKKTKRKSGKSPSALKPYPVSRF